MSAERPDEHGSPNGGPAGRGAPLAEALVETELERRSLARLREVAGEVDGPMERHGGRCFLFCERLAERRGIEFDRELTLCASLLHDIGIYPQVSEGGVYTEESGAIARELFAAAGADPERCRLVYDACAYHHALGGQWHRGAEVELLRLADRIEVCGGLVRSGLTRDEIAAVFAAAPRDGFYATIVKLGLRALRDRPQTLLRIFDSERERAS